MTRPRSRILEETWPRATKSRGFDPEIEREPKEGHAPDA